MLADDLMTRKYWGTREIIKFTNQPESTVCVWVKQKNFPDPDHVLGTRLRAWNRADVVKWWNEKQKAKAS